jgi:hypothetical protein
MKLMHRGPMTCGEEYATLDMLIIVFLWMILCAHLPFEAAAPAIRLVLDSSQDR